MTDRQWEIEDMPVLWMSDHLDQGRAAFTRSAIQLPTTIDQVVHQFE